MSGGVGGGLERWRQFTPETVDASKCMARVWNGGRGGQCRSKCVADSDFCRSHGKQSDAGSLSHGRVDGDIPEPKYEEFVRESQSARFKK